MQGVSSAHYVHLSIKLQVEKVFTNLLLQYIRHVLLILRSQTIKLATQIYFSSCFIDYQEKDVGSNEGIMKYLFMDVASFSILVHSFS